ncbi:MAG: hypothetical protein WCG15_08655 [Actinomycetes bacterium]|jgi:hypothetical protein
MNEDTELQISQDVYDEILRNTDKKNYINQTERVLRKAMVSLVKSGHATFLFLRDEESRAWWGKTVKLAAATVEKRREAWRVYEIRQKAWDRLSEEDRKILKLRKPTMPKGEKPNG